MLNPSFITAYFERASHFQFEFEILACGVTTHNLNIFVCHVLHAEHIGDMWLECSIIDTIDVEVVLDLELSIF